MTSVAVMVLALAEIGTGTLRGERVSARAVVDAPKRFVDRTIVLTDIPCVNAKSGFLCVAIVGGQALRIEAGGLGARTRIEIAERLTGDCKGTANLARPACRFDIEIKPVTAYKDMLDTPDGTMPVAGIFTGLIEMATPKRR